MGVAVAPPAEGLVERATALVPTLREKAAATEEARRVLPEHFEALSDAGIFKMCAPKRFGGYEADFRTQSDVLSEIARGCPSTSWVATIFSAMAWLAGVMPDEVQDEVFADGDPRIGGVFAPTGTATREKGGLLVNGQWAFNTGCAGARWTFLNTLVPNDDGEAVPTAVLVPSSELTILDDWYASGMTGTGSNSVAAKDVFVPAYRSYPLPAMVEANFPESKSSDNPYFRLPTVSVLIVNAGGTPLGIARGAYESFLERLPGRAIRFTNYFDQSEAAITHLQVGEAALKLDSVDSHIRRACEILDGNMGSPLSLEQRVRARAHVSHATQLAREIADVLFSASGASSIQPNVPIQRFQRDIQALANHGLMSPATTTELLGRVVCGLEPNTPFF